MNKKIIIDKKWIEQEYCVFHKSLRDIGRNVGISYQTVRRRMVESEFPLRTNKDGIRLKIAKKFDKNKTKSLSYILGVRFGDGFLSENKGKRLIGLSIAERDSRFAESFINALADIGLHSSVWRVELKKKNPSLSDQIRIVAASTLFYEWCRPLDIDKVEELVTHDVVCMKEFIRGFYESEGTIYKNNNRKSGYISNCLGLRMVNTNKSIFDLVGKILLQLGFRFYRHEEVRNGKPYFYLGIWKREEISRFIREINPVIKREPRPEGCNKIMSFASIL